MNKRRKTTSPERRVKMRTTAFTTFGLESIAMAPIMRKKQIRCQHQMCKNPRERGPAPSLESCKSHNEREQGNRKETAQPEVKGNVNGQGEEKTLNKTIHQLGTVP
jgi:hypothetical protein